MSGAWLTAGLPAKVQEVVPAIALPLAMQGTPPGVASPVPTRAPPITTWLPESLVILPPGVMMSVCGVSSEADQALP